MHARLGVHFSSPLILSISRPTHFLFFISGALSIIYTRSLLEVPTAVKSSPTILNRFITKNEKKTDDRTPMQTPIKKQTTATAISTKHSLENSAKVISRDIRALLGGYEHVASNYDDSAGLKMYESLQEAVWKLPGVLTPGTPQEILPIQPPQPLHYLGISHTRIFIREFRSMERFFLFFSLWVAD